MSKWLVVVVLCAAVGILLMWQQQRERAIATCLSGGGVWNGSRSTCEPMSVRPILQRDLQRS